MLDGYDTIQSTPFSERIQKYILRQEQTGHSARHNGIVVIPPSGIWRKMGNRTFYRLYGLYHSSHLDSKTHGLQEAINNANSKIFIKDGIYDLTAAPLQTWNTTVGASGCKLLFPQRSIVTQAIKPISLEGESSICPNGEVLGYTKPSLGAIIKDTSDDITLGYADGVNYVILASAFQGNYNSLNATSVNLKNLTFLVKAGRGFGGIDLQGATGMTIDDVFLGVDSIWPLPAPSGYISGKSQYALVTQVGGSNGNNIGRLFIMGFAVGLGLNEHLNIDFLQIIATQAAIVLGAGMTPIGCHIGFIHSEWNAKIIVAAGPPGTGDNVSISIGKLMITDNQDPTNMSWCNPSTYIENGTNPQWQFDIDTMEVNYTTLTSLQAAITGGAGIRIRNLYPESFNSPTLSTNPPVSSTVYQNTNGANIIICLPAYATTPGTPGTIQVQVANTSANLGTKYRNSTELIDGDTAAASPRIILIHVRSGWFYKVILTGTTVAAATIAPALS